MNPPDLEVWQGSGYNRAMIDLNILFIVTVGFIAIALFSLIRLFILDRRLSNLLTGKRGGDLEHVIEEFVKTARRLDERTKLIAQEIDNINGRLAKAIQKVHTVRYNPFRDQGGNQSFATCFMDENGDGLVISSLYSRDKVSVYAKPLKDGKSEYELSQEEKESIDKASSL
ncbi:MAG TPA: DUF4446 family protein [Candidatus Paceibacterota bacterium]|nr:DUF4446 family protein [Candidatus Paceibacterota bacterium]